MMAATCLGVAATPTCCTHDHRCVASGLAGIGGVGLLPPAVAIVAPVVVAPLSTMAWVCEPPHRCYALRDCSCFFERLWHRQKHVASDGGMQATDETIH